MGKDWCGLFENDVSHRGFQIPVLAHTLDPNSVIPPLSLEYVSQGLGIEDGGPVGKGTSGTLEVF